MIWGKSLPVKELKFSTLAFILFLFIGSTASQQQQQLATVTTQPTESISKVENKKKRTEINRENKGFYKLKICQWVVCTMYRWGSNFFFKYIYIK